MLVARRLKLAIGTVGTFKLLLVAKQRVPFATADRLIARLPRCPAEPAPGKDILAPAKQTAKQRDSFLKRKRRLLYAGLRPPLDAIGIEQPAKSIDFRP